MHGRKRGALWFNGIGLLLYGVIALLPFGDVFLRPLETRFAATHKRQNRLKFCVRRSAQPEG